MLANQRPGRHAVPWAFFLLVFALSVPFWLIGAVSGQGLQHALRINLPISSLMTFNPLIAAVILTYRERGSAGARELLKRAIDYGRITRRRWYLPVLCLLPLLMALAYELMRLAGATLPHPRIPILLVPVFFVVFAIGAVGEEVGWQGYAFDRLEQRWNALAAAVILGIVWAAWHIVPFVQAHNSPAWIAWQCQGQIALRVLIAWIYQNTGKSVFATILFHATSNVSEFLFPNYGSHYNPFTAWVVMMLAAVIVTIVWGPATLARDRYARR